nr:DUF3857 domain-containing protein [Bacteroidota bacterium]
MVFQKKKKYSVKEIPAELLENARSVVRHYSTELKIYSRSSAVKSVFLAITVINKNGLDDSELVLFYDKFSRIKKINARIYNADGEKVKSVDQDEIMDFSAAASYSIYEDTRVRIVDPEYRNYPFTVEYTYEISYSGILDYEDWMPIKDYNISNEFSKLSIITPNDLDIQYLTENTDVEVHLEDDGKQATYTWIFIDVPAFSEEEFSSPLEDIFPKVYLAPVDFEIDGYVGDFSSWKNFGLWIKMLNEKNSYFSEESRQDILRVSELETNELDKIKALYEYLQNKTRYANISIGIGSWQPSSPEKVHQLSYGDCKALTHYMHSILDVVNVQSYYTLIRAGEFAPNILINFPSNQFNHAILCIPMDQDTVWLECTNQHNPFGYLSTFIDGRNALLINDDGGVVTQTGTCTMAENKKQCNSVIQIFENLTANLDINTTYGGLFYDEMYPLLHLNAEETEKLIRSKLNLANYELKNFSVYESIQSVPVIVEELKVNQNHVCTELKNRYILPLNVLKERVSVPVNTHQRKSEIYIRRPFQKVDTVTFLIHEGFSIDFIPEDFTLQSPYGNFETSVEVNGQEITYIQSFSLKNGEYSKGEYEQFVNFFEEIHNNDDPKCILRKKN